MAHDDLQEAWESQEGGSRITMDAQVLLKEVQRNERSFRGTVFWRDVREAVVGVAVAIVFFAAGAKSLWSWCVPGFTVLGVVVFLIADRVRQKRKGPVYGDSVIECVQSSLAQVSHQIWLLKNVFWWYILPPAIGILVPLGHMMILVFTTHNNWFAQAYLLMTGLVCALVFYGVYRFNQWAVRKELEPRKAELEELLTVVP